MPVNGQVQSGEVELVVDEGGRVLRASATRAAERLLDRAPPGESVLRAIHPDDRDLYQILAARALRSGDDATVELRWARPNDRWSRIRTTLCPDAAGSVRILLRRDDVRALRRAEEQMRRVVEGSAQGIIVRTHNELLYMNDSFARILGYATHRECIDNQEHVNGMIHSDDLPMVMAHLQARIRGEEAVSHYELRLIHRDGTPIWMEAHAANVNWNGKSASLSWLTDISRRKAIEEELMRSKNAAEFANRTKTQFLANMSHELRTPLNAILGFSEVIGQQIFGPVSEKYLGYAGDIHRSGQLLLELVNDVLDLAKLEAGKLELRESELCVAELVDECLTLLRNRAGEQHVRLICDVPKTLPLLRADARAVKQLLLNFLSNAVKFTPDGGEVKVRAACDARGGFCPSVTDTGIGMSSAEIEVALSPFGQIDSKLARKHDGTGLGLPICRSLMDLHGGALTLASTPGAGTTLAAWFPAARVIAAPKRSAG
jgi:PAS domain S-box-containing protein